MMSDDDVTKGLQEHVLIGFRAQAIEMGLLRLCVNPRESEMNAIFHEMELEHRRPNKGETHQIFNSLTWLK